MSAADTPTLPPSALTPLDDRPIPGISQELAAALAGSSTETGRYAVGAQLGRGASSVVHALEDRVLHRTLAVKRMRPEHVEALGNAFLREARFLASLDHPAIPAVYDYGLDQDGRPFVVMQRFEGEHLGTVLRKRGPIRSGVALQILLEQLSRIAGGLSHAHQRGLLHLDLKVGNLVSGTFDQLWLVDWGNALPRAWWPRCFDRPLGTLSTMSPEQARGGPFDVRTDIFGFGACLFTALTGHAPHRGPREVRLGRLLANEPVPPLAPSVAALIPESLLSLAYQCMAPDPSGRPDSAAALKQMLDEHRRGTDLLPRRTAPAGTVLATEGEPGDTAWYVLHGAVDVHQSGRGLIRTVGTGAILGELAPVLGTRRTATLTVREDAVLATISGHSLRDTSALGPIGTRLLEALAQRLLSTERSFTAQEA